MRTAGRKDRTQADIVKALRKVGAWVYVMNQNGVPDLLVFYQGRWFPVEVKSPRGRFTLRQQAVWRHWPMFPVVRSVAEALALFGVTV